LELAIGFLDVFKFNGGERHLGEKRRGVVVGCWFV
jgi:hypothetical protein